ncbi:MAG: hypothetical protein R3Y50_07840 [Rikenellaceae bacterium]
MENIKEFIIDISKPMSIYIKAHVFIYLYPAFFIIFTLIVGTTYKFLHLYSDTLFFILWGLSYLFIPAVLWLIATKIFKKIHPTITVIYFIIFVIMQFLALIFIFILMVLNWAEADLN